jgi:soluble lytic murein transglycosylase
MRRCSALFAALLALATPARAQPTIMSALQARDFTAAEALARAVPDPLAAKLARYLRLLAPHQASAQELGAFIAANPAWPQQKLLQTRLSEATAAITDDATALTVCEAYVPHAATALLRCAAAERAAGHAPQAADLARQAWIAGITGAAAEAAFLQQWGSALDANTQWQRFDALAWRNDPAAAAQVARVDPARQALAAARVALRRNDPAAADLLASVPQTQQSDPVLLLERTRWLRCNGSLAAAAALWRNSVSVAEKTVAASKRAAFWNEREKLGRLLLQQDDAAGAYFLADDAAAAGDEATEAHFLSGWIALEKLHDRGRATAHFQAIAATAQAVITQARAWYWLGRAAPDDAAAKSDFAHAAAFPTTYYGQRAAAQLGGQIAERILALPEPTPVPAAAQAFDASELIHAAMMLHDWGDASDSRRFLLQYMQANQAVPAIVLTARRALALGFPDVAVAAARMAGHAGIALPHLGWPAPFQPPGGVPAPLALALMRQESSFDAAVVSNAGAHGLMQLLPATARQIDAGLHESAADLADPNTNMRIGVAYLHRLLDEFDGVQPYALAAYNAGPRRAREWIAANGDAAATNDPDAMIDWIEQIPFAETRNYVQRVLESTEVYQTFEAQ